MNLSPDQVNFLDSILEANAVAAHDFSGQIHVIQFCGEELENHISSDGAKFLERMNKSINSLTNYVQSFRSFLKAHRIPGAEDSLTFGNAHLWNLHTLDIHYMKEFNLFEVINFSFNESLESFEIRKNELEFLAINFSLYALLIDYYKEFINSRVKLNLSLNKVDPGQTLISMEDEDNQMSEEKFLSLLDSDLVGSKRSARRIFGNQLLKDAFEGKSELFKVEFKCSRGIGIYLHIM